MTHDFVALPSRWRMAKLVLVGIVFGVVGLEMAGIISLPPHPHRQPDTFVVAKGWFCVVVCALITFFLVLKLFDADEQLRVGVSGIRWRRWSDQTIPWSEVTDVTIWKFKGQSSIILHLRDRTRFPGRGILAALAGPNRLLTGGDIWISMEGTDRSFDEALAAIDQFRARSHRRMR